MSLASLLAVIEPDGRLLSVDPATGTDLRALFTFLAKTPLRVWSEAKPTNSQVIARFVAAQAMTLPAAASGSAASAATAATADAVFSIKNGSTEIATVTFAAAAATGTFAAAAAASIAAGDVITVVGPASADATLAKIAMTIVLDIA